MGVFTMVVAIVAIATLGEMVKAIAGRQRPGLDEASRKQLQELTARLEANDLRLIEAETKVEELEEKLRFMEKLLAEPGRPAQLRP